MTAQFIVMLVMLFSLRKRKENVVRKVRLLQKVPSACVKEICRIGIPTALQSTVYCLISMVLTRMASGFGAGAIATFRVGGQIESLSLEHCGWVRSCPERLRGPNYGAGKMDRVKEGIRTGCTDGHSLGRPDPPGLCAVPRQLSPDVLP